MESKKAIEIENKTVPLDIIESENANQYRLEIGIDRRLRVIVPKRKSEDIETLISEKRDWILEKLDKFEELYSKAPERKFEEGEELLYLGKTYTLKIESQGKKSENVEIKNNQLVVYSDSESKGKIKNMLKSWYSEKGEEIITDLVKKYSEETGIEYNNIFIKNQKTRWGSSSQKKNLNFNWRLVMAPKKIIEYIVVHELVHLEENKHTNRFWRKVRDICPDYEKRDEWLRENSSKLIFTERDL